MSHGVGNMFRVIGQMLDIVVLNTITLVMYIWTFINYYYVICFYTNGG